MTHSIMLIPTNSDVGLTSVAAGLVRAIENQGIRVNFFKPIAQRELTGSTPEHSSHLIAINSTVKPPTPIPILQAKRLLSLGHWDELLEAVVARYQQASQAVDIVIIEGLVTTKDQNYANRLNKEIANALDTEIILVTAIADASEAGFVNQLNIAARTYGGMTNEKVLGAIVNRVGAISQRLQVHQDQSELIAAEQERHQQIIKQCKLFTDQFKLLGTIPWHPQLVAPRVLDIANFLEANIINSGEYKERRIQQTSLCARSMINMIGALKPGTLIITPGDRSDIILATSMAALNGVKIAALLLTGNYQPEAPLLTLCQKALESGLPILSVAHDSYGTALLLPQFDLKVPLDDVERIDAVKNHTAEFIETGWLQPFISTNYQRRLSPPAFRFQLIESARKAKRRIVLPEGEEPRTIEAANRCTEQGIAHCLLLGNPDEIAKIAQYNGLALNPNLEIINPETIRNHYLEPLVSLRKHKGVTELIAAEQLQDNVVLGTMMLQQGHVDGLVSGAIHTTANTIRPALQLIKTAANTSLVSSIFFMCLPDQVLVYGDCAVNPDPSAEQLADIAIQSADSAKKFGIDPKVAMLSYSTGSSGAGTDVEKVRQATELVKQKRPDIVIDGPLQYDAALIKSVAQKKAPNSPVAGQATVFIFPDLNTGNTTYKAVQRSADVVCIGPMLQGLNKPVNDLSRGALADDILFTIALTAIQGN